jgi:hypothetical protein
MTFSTPQAVQERLEELDNDLALLQNSIEDAAMAHFRTKRDREKQKALAFLAAKGTDFARRAQAEMAVADVGREEEGKWEALRAVLKTLEARAMVGDSILKAQSRP